MDNMTTASSVLVTEGGFDIPLSIPTILNPSNLILEAKKSPIVFLKEKTTMNALLYNGSIPIIRANKGDLVKARTSYQEALRSLGKATSGLHESINMKLDAVGGAPLAEQAS